MRSPSRMVGRIEPEGTSFQSAMTERIGDMTATTAPMGMTHSRIRRWRNERLGLSALGAGSGVLSVGAGEDGSFVIICIVPFFRGWFSPVADFPALVQL